MASIKSVLLQKPENCYYAEYIEPWINLRMISILV